MGAHSTITYTGAAAREAITEALPDLDIKTLERLMDVILDQQLHNCVIVPASVAQADTVMTAEERKRFNERRGT